ncbi:hypothetical protein EVAR_61738_1 [Eumeta japonica]|uniref:Uncharacterized protein n=1 Tax=Eumeta variegata TaxID=151549 RepID=A0A4C1YMR6_EUMVA|nr:hypothetical protein EVAR_61738_1 [Eumeta japonica]
MPESFQTLERFSFTVNPSAGRRALAGLAPRHTAARASRRITSSLDDFRCNGIPHPIKAFKRRSKFPFRQLVTRTSSNSCVELL